MSQSDIINSRQIQWFPGHMTKTLRLMEKEIRNVDCVLQILDARIPLSSLNPEIERITAGKPHLYVLNKSDLADPEITKQWLTYFKSAGAGCIAMDSKQRGRATATKGLIEKELSALMERRRSRGMVGAAIRVMIVGIPNVGKSTFINSFAGTTRAKAANKPGVTRGKQWISVDSFDLIYLLQAMQEILQNCPEAHIKVAGISVLGVNGIKSRIKIPAYGKYLRRLILKNRLEGKVRVLGNLSAEEMKREYLSAQIFVCPSAVENSPNSVAEGQLLGVPVAASRTGGIPDVVKDGVSGLLFEKGNVHELAACVSRILTDKQLAKELSASERETAAKLYNGENNYQKLIEIYQSIE